MRACGCYHYCSSCVSNEVVKIENFQRMRPRVKASHRLSLTPSVSVCPSLTSFSVLFLFLCGLCVALLPHTRSSSSCLLLLNFTALPQSFLFICPFCLLRFRHSFFLQYSVLIKCIKRVCETAKSFIAVYNKW